jgi:hypothetical protein
VTLALRREDDGFVDAQGYVLIAGEEIRATGRLVRTGERDWFDPPLAQRAIGYGPGGAPAPRPSTFAIPVEGADFARVARRYERDGSIEGYATIYGGWLGDRIRIDHQTDELPDRGFPTWSDPPCPAPPEGWPHGMNGRLDDNLDFDLGDLEDTGTAVTTVIFRPSDDQAVLVVAATDIAEVEARLRPQLPDRLCVVPSRWTREQLDAAQRHFTAMAKRWRLYGWGPRCDEQAQASMTATLVKVTDEIAQWVASQPDGLVVLEPWLMPTRPLG